MKLVKLGLASIIAFSFSDANAIEQSVRVLGSFGFGGATLTKKGDGKNKTIKEAYAAHKAKQGEVFNFGKQAELEKAEKDKKAAEGKMKTSAAEITDTQVQAVSMASDPSSIVDPKEKAYYDSLTEFRSAEGKVSALNSEKARLEGTHDSGKRAAHAKFIKDHDLESIEGDKLEAHIAGLKDENEEQKLSGIGFGAGIDYRALFDISSSFKVGAIVSYDFLYVSYEKDEKKKDEKAAPAANAAATPGATAGATPTAPAAKAAKNDEKKDDKYSLVSHLVTAGIAGEWKIVDSMSVSFTFTGGIVSRGLKYNDNEVQIGGIKGVFVPGISFEYAFNSMIFMTVGFRYAIVLSGDVKFDDEAKKTEGQQPAKDGKGDKSSEKPVDHHLSGDYMIINLGVGFRF